MPEGQPVYEACLLLGSNLAPEVNLPKAIALLAERFTLKHISQTWETPAVGSDGPNFLNAALLLLTTLAPADLKEQVLRPLEASLGRVRSHDKNAPRTIDIDVIVWDSRQIEPALQRHAHIAVPVAELMPDYRPNGAGEPLQLAASRLRRLTPIRTRPELQL